MAPNLIPPLSHTEVVDEAIAPTCTQNGFTEGKHCATCNKILVASNLIPALSHSLSDWIVDSGADCPHNGSKHIECTTCGQVIQTENNINESDWIVTTEATCTSAGLKHKECTVCATVIKQEKINELNHIEVITAGQAPTCTQDGWSEGKRCIRCNETLVERKVIKARHTLITIIDQTATCMQTGQQHQECTVCRKVFEITTTPITSHDYLVSTSLAATCTKEGCITATCKYCSKFKIDTIAPIGHSISKYDEYEAATCEDSGHATGRCDTCGKLVEITYPAKGHTAGERHDSNDYCGIQRGGYVLCVDCGVTLYEYGHIYERTKQDATCSKDGMYIYTCVHCGDSYTEIIAAYGHVSGEWLTTQEATCSKNGVETQYCVTCNTLIDTKYTEKIEHLYESNPGSTGIEYTCVYCSNSYFVQTSEMYTITFVSNGGTEYQSLMVSGGHSLTLPTPQKEGYTFAGWYLDSSLSNLCSEKHIFDKDTTLYAGWYLSEIEGEANSNNIILNVPLTFTFEVETGLSLTNKNLKNYIHIQSIDGKIPSIYIAAVNGNKYTIACDEYESCMQYSVSILNSLRFIEFSGYEFWFMTEGENFCNIEFNAGVIFLPDNEIFSVYEENEEIYVFLLEDRLNPEDIVVVYGSDKEDILFVMEVVAEGQANTLFAYQVVAADANEVFASYDIMYSGKLDVGDIEFEKNLEEELTEQLLASSVYAEFEYTARMFATRTTTTEYTYKFKNISAGKPSFSKKDSTLIFEFKIVANFERINQMNGVKDGEFKIVLKLTTSMEFEVTSRFVSVDDFSFIVDIDTSIRADLYATSGLSDKDNEELSYFKKLFAKTREEGKFKQVESSTAQSQKETSFASISIPFHGVRFIVDLSNVISFEAVGEIGFSAQVDFIVTVGVKNSTSEGFEVIKEFASHNSFSFYILGKVKASNLFKVKATLSVCGIVNAYMEFSCGPYIELGGMFTVSVSGGGGANSVLGGYFEEGFNMDVKVGVSAELNIRVWRWKKKITVFNKSWEVYSDKIVVISMGEKETWLYFAETDEVLTKEYACGSTIDLSGVVNTYAYKQNLTSMSKSLAKTNCKYYLEGTYDNVVLTENGTLRMLAIDGNTFTVKVKLVYGNIIKYATITFTVKHDDKVQVGAKQPTCTEDGYMAHEMCKNCHGAVGNKVIIPALGHKTVVDARVEPTCSTLGKTEGAHCSVCKEILVEQKEIPMTNHHFVNGKCTDCQAVQYSQGLVFESNGDGTCFVSDIGSCTDKDIIIPSISPTGERVTGIGAYAFRSSAFHYLTFVSITIPDSVISIGDYAFQDCDSLMSIVIPDSITSIGKGAFIGCDDLADEDGFVIVKDILFDYFGQDSAIVIPNGVIRIDSEAFKLKRKIKSVTLPDSVTHISDYAFHGCNNLANVNTGKGLTNIGEGAFKGCSNLARITIPKGVTSIGDRAFMECENLADENGFVIVKGILFDYFGDAQTVVVPDGVTCIGDLAFGMCESLTTITIPDSVANIGVYAFYKCSNLTSITIPEGIPSIGDYAFYGCSSLTSVNIPNSVTSIGDNAFESCYNLTSVTIGNGVTSIGDYAFRNCYSLASIIVPNGVTSIGKEAFKGCGNLTDEAGFVIVKGILFDYGGYEEIVSVPEGVTSIDDKAFYQRDWMMSITIPDSVMSIGESAFESCYSLKIVTIGNGVKSIGYRAFALCENLKIVSIGNGVKSIGDYAFYECSNLASVNIPDGVTTIGEYAFSDCSSLSNIIIPNSVTSISDSSFEYCSELTSIIIPDSVTSIGASAFAGCSSLVSIAIPDSVTSIGAGAFVGCSSLLSIAIPDSVTSIGAGAFVGCSSLVSIAIPDGVTSIGSFAFQGCSSLTSIIIPNGVTTIGEHAFSDCSSLVSIVIPDGVTSIGSDTFDNCTRLTSIIIPDSVTSIGSSAFYRCTGLTSIIIPSGITSIDYNVFGGCSSLVSIVISDGVTSIGSSAFRGCSSLTSIIIPNGVTTIGINAFDGCSSLASIIIPDSVRKINDYAFKNCSSLTTATIGNGVTSIGAEAFYKCSSLTSIIIPDSVTSIGSGALRDCSNLTSATIGNGITSIRSDMFYGCSNLTSVTIGYRVTSIGGEAFCKCSSLTSIIIPESVTSIGLLAFKECSSLKSITFKGSMARWNNVSKSTSWLSNSVPATVVHCSDGDVAIK